MFKTYVKRVCGGVIVSAGLGGAYILSTDEGSRRSLQFWGNIFPLYMHYRSVQFLNRDTGIISDAYAESIYESLNQMYTTHVKNVTYKMRGFYLKQAQLLSTRNEFVPKAYMDWVKDTQSNVPPIMNATEVREFVAQKLQDELSLRFEDVFYDWEDEPLGVASIGQVHRCKLKSNGSTVVVKFQLPGMEKMFRSDIHTLRTFCQLAMPQHVSSFAEIEKQFTSEFDYKIEALNLHTVRDNVLPYWSQYVDIPKPHLELCSKHLLTMDYMEGPKLVDGIKDYYRKTCESMGKSYEEMEAEQLKALAEGKIKYKTLEEAKWANRVTKTSLILKDIFISFNPLRFAYNISPLRLISGAAAYKWTPAPLDLTEIIEILCRVHASEIFNDGFFNGDCHPGNILLLNDGRLGLIDYGQVKQLDTADRIKYAKLILALASDNKKEIVRLHFDEIGTKTKYRKDDIAYLASCFWNDRDTADVLGGRNISSFIDWLESEDPMVQLPEEFIFCARVSIMMRGLGNAFGLKLRVSKLWEDEAKKFLVSQGVIF